MGAASIGFVATANATLQLTSDPAMRGRVMALYAMAFLGTTPIGAPLVGAIAQWTNPRVALLAGAVATVAAAGLLMWRHQARLRTDEGADDTRIHLVEVRAAEPGSAGGQEHDVVVGEATIDTHEGQSLEHGLGDQHPIERIRMVCRQSTGGYRMLSGHGKSGELVSDGRNEVVRCIQSAVRLLDRDLPHRCGGDNHRMLGIGDRRRRPVGECRVIGKPPQEDVRIDEQVHVRSPLNAAATSSGSSSKSSWMWTRPAQTPGVRAGRGRAGTSRATTCPARAISTSSASPDSTAATRRDRLVLASCMFTCMLRA
jgi:hypothetical protein